MIKIKKFVAVIILFIAITIFPSKVFSLNANEEGHQYKESTVIKYKKVYADNLNVRNGPGLDYEKIGVLKENQKVQVLFKVSNWYKIKFKDGYGWCREDYLSQSIMGTIEHKEKDIKNDSKSNKVIESKHCIAIKTITNTMAYYQDGVLIKQFDVATGKQSTPTPKGKFKIVNKIVNRPYYKDNIPGGDPRNPLGKRWLGLKVGDTDGTTYGIHGNSNENSIGKSVSGGCIRMHNDEISWLFDQVPKETVVVISEEDKSFKEILKSYNISVN
ncbi:L,D-transpeptidase family protein [Paraclostridium sordellii]|uniref:Cell surface protein n=1 Tax=Paraclostridium sordellii TaxID=1505 RepID=A0A9P1KYY2_PARSO|nr:L,D-transpeptidase family protein [Paeniclostridium sordellii]CEO32756.1 cell surface protein [[Clostridium] sordellii] [Paeniclostridium sordellii]